jgi:predicted nucleic acid-binding protein
MLGEVGRKKQRNLVGHRLSWCDSLILGAALEATALEARCERRYSEDFPHGRKIEDLGIENPFV